MIDQAIIRFRKLVDSLGHVDIHVANEATTRKRVIDTILESVLGWNPDTDISYEERVTEDHVTKFSDYIIRTPSTALIVEAKRLGETFNVPPNRKTCLLGGAVAGTPAGDACIQVREYCRKKSIPFAVATNGSCWIVFPAVRTDGVQYEQTHAHVFQDFADIETRFIEFWHLLSRDRVIEGGLETTLFGSKDDVVKRRLLSVLKEPGFRIGRNSVYEHIESAVAIAMTDEALLKDVDGLNFCYVKTSERIKYDSRLRTHFLDVKPDLERRVIRPRHKKGKDKYLDKVIETTNVERPLQFVLLLGPVGAGKSTFLEYTRRVTASDVINKRIAWLKVDFKPATTADDPRAFLYGKLLEAIDADTDFSLGSWDKTLKQAYAPLIDMLKKGALALLAECDPDAFKKEVSTKVFEDRKAVLPYVRTVLKYFASRTPCFLVVDNVDQIEDVDYQKKVFLETQAAAREMGLHAILSLRDATYLRHMHSPIFDAFQLDSIFIDPPQIVPVLSRRFAYAKQFITGKKATIACENGIKFVVDDLGSFFSILTESLLSEDTGFMLEVLSGNNVRRGLTLVRNFMSSGHTSADKALYKYCIDGTFKFAPHEFFKGAILSQRQYWREEESILPNIFDSHHGKMATQLLRFILVSRLKRFGATEDFAGEPVATILDFWYACGVSRKDGMTIILDLVHFGLLQTYGGRAMEDDAAVLATRLGAYMVQELACRFHFFEPCMIDAFIHDDPTWDALNESSQKIQASRGYQRMEARVERSRCFLAYLQACQDEWVVLAMKCGGDALWSDKYVHNSLVPALDQEFTKVLTSAEKQIQREKIALKQRQDRAFAPR